MYCPECRYEYRSGFTKCSDCGVDLVEELPPAEEHNNPADLNFEQARNPNIYAVATSSSGELANILAILDDAEVPHQEIIRRPAMPGIGLGETAILVEPQFRQRADQAIQDWRASIELPADDSAQPLSADFVPADFNPEDATAEVWSGDDLDLHDTLVECLDNVGIGCATHLEDSSAAGSAPKPNTIFVLPSDEKRAREVIREVVDASPPA